MFWMVLKLKVHSWKLAKYYWKFYYMKCEYKGQICRLLSKNAGNKIIAQYIYDTIFLI